MDRLLGLSASHGSEMQSFLENIPVIDQGFILVLNGKGSFKMILCEPRYIVSYIRQVLTSMQLLPISKCVSYDNSSNNVRYD